MRFFLSVTILSVFLLIILQMKLNFKPNQVLQRNYRPTARIIISEKTAAGRASDSKPPEASEAEEIRTKASINDDLPQLYQERRKHVENICSAYHEELERDYKRFQPLKTWKSVVTKADVFHSRNKIPFLWCRVPKASSQSWNDLFVHVWYRKYLIYTPGRQQMQLRKAWTPRSKSQKFFYGTNDRIFSFMISRHPFERILSAYRDKFFINGDDPYEKRKVARFYQFYGKEILKKFRNSSTNLDDNPKFKKAPTFKEFINYLVSLPLRRLDSHWLPTYFQCMPCHIKYSILARIDTMAEDSEEILKRIGVMKHLPFHHMTQGQTSDKTVDTYYADIELSTMEKLFQLYRMDFLLFGYTPDYFYNLVKNKTQN